MQWQGEWSPHALCCHSTIEKKFTEIKTTAKTDALNLLLQSGRARSRQAGRVPGPTPRKGPPIRTGGNPLPRRGARSRQAGRVPGPTPRKGPPIRTGGNPLPRRGARSQAIDRNEF
ncbi:hypothetical protein RRG08_051086 [Elysia crispata]|uniref:Uncharacterized protein n=1 Tax=Elysia crispata TaxID=231223 RepID=A0AAE1AD99_9GAST|nr:hypothetical protein RRG08_051086 [Elysia crispata]